MPRTPQRDDFLPVIVGGDVGAYPLAREFYEAFGVRSVCVNPDPISAIKTSRFIDVHLIEHQDDERILEAVRQVARAAGSRRVILMANQDAVIGRLERIRDDLPDNVSCIVPPLEPMERASNKITFARMCEEYGLDYPRLEVVHLAGSDPVPPTSLPFPVVAKPAVSSSEYVRLYPLGFSKVYFADSQEDLDGIWASLREVGFEGDFLVQELIEGDDTHVDIMTVYMGQDGEPHLFSSAQVLLEDHDPKLIGNPVTLLTRPMPELWEKVAGMLRGIGWRGFANFDMKRDPVTGRELFMDFNPRIGCSSYYSCAGGVNPMRVLVEDVMDGAAGIERVSRAGVYTRAPAWFVRRYLTDGALRDEFDAARRAGLVFDPMRCPEDTLPSRLAGLAMELNFVRKFSRFYPRPTGSAR